MNKEKQHDSVGFNIVEELPRLLYKKLLEGELKLYTNAAKELVIDPSNLIKLEQDNHIRFDAVPDLFVNELWSKLGRRFEFKILGFSFFARKKDNSLLNFGFIDIMDIKDQLISTLISTNANGGNELNMWDAIHSKAYPFQIVKFGGHDLVKKPELAIKLKKKAMCQKVQPNTYKIPMSKRVWSTVYPSKEIGLDNKLICQSLEGYYQKNKHEVLEFILIPDLHIRKNYPIIVTEVELEELWTWDNDLITKKIVRIRPSVNGVPLGYLSWNNLKEKNILRDFRALTDLLEDHNYAANITQINDEIIEREYRIGVSNNLNKSYFNKILIRTN